MLTQIDVVYGDQQAAQALALPIANISTTDSLLVRKVTGLNAPPLDLFIGEYSRDGGIFQGRRVGNRNVVMTIDLNPNFALGETVDGLRALVYKTFADPSIEADFIQLVFHDDELPDRYLYGYTETIETEIFDIETSVQVSMICPDPYIRDLTLTELTHTTGWVTVPFTYRGTAKTGFIASIRVTADTPTVTLSNNNRTMVLNHSFLVNDVITINTNRGDRDIILTREGVNSPLIAKLSPTSRWLELHAQSNTMTVYGATTGDLDAVIKSLTYSSTYWGI